MSQCRSCGQEIGWVELKSGKKHPVDQEEIEWDHSEVGDLLITELGDTVKNTGQKNPHPNLAYFISHFATCPDADDWRKSK